MRISKECLAVLDAWAALYRSRWDKPVTRAQVIERMVRRAVPPDDLSIEALHVREAHKALVGNEVVV